MIFVSFSGGLDSTTLLAMLREQTKDTGEGITPVFFDYGSKHNPFELEAAKAIADHYGYALTLQIVDLKSCGIFNRNSSALMADNGQDVPAAAYSEEGSLAATVVPGRNMVMASILASMAEAHWLWTYRNVQHVGAPQQGNTIALAVHGGDHALYPDCRFGFTMPLGVTIEQGTEARVRLVTPFLEMTKAEIVHQGLELGVPFELTRSCYRQQGMACGVCGTCQERLAAFEQNGHRDPAEYATGVLRNYL